MIVYIHPMSLKLLKSAFSFWRANVKILPLYWTSLLRCKLLLLHYCRDQGAVGSSLTGVTALCP